MTREEQIKEASIDHRKDLTASGYFSESECRMGADGFYQGAMWADANPGWHKYPDDKPDKNGRYWVAFETPSEKCMEITTFHDSQFQSLYFEEDSGYEDDFLDADCIIAWMELPQPPKFEKQ